MPGIICEADCSQDSPGRLRIHRTTHNTCKHQLRRQLRRAIGKRTATQEHCHTGARYAWHSVHTCTDALVACKRKPVASTYQARAVSAGGMGDEDIDVAVFRFTLGIPGFDDRFIPRVVGLALAAALAINNLLGAQPAPDTQVDGWMDMRTRGSHHRLTVQPAVQQGLQPARRALSMCISGRACLRHRHLALSLRQPASHLACH